MTGAEYWIGLLKVNPKDKSADEAYWIDGNPSTYRNIASPSNNGNSDAYVLGHNGKWVDQNGNKNYKYICKGVANA